MAIRKEECGNLTAEEEGLLEKAERFLDQMLAEKYDPQRNVGVYIPLDLLTKAVGNTLTPRIKRAIERRYQQAGWKAHFQTEGGEKSQIRFS